jgi:sugar transferase (PEP-CTERM/EpsH1 system associated)
LKRILLINSGFPYPPTSGARIRDFHLIRQVSQAFKIVLLCLLQFPEERDRVEGLKPYCETIEVVSPIPQTFFANITGALRALLNRNPLAAYPYYSPQLAQKLREILKQQQIDVIQIEHSFLAPYADAIPLRRRYKTILSFHNVGERQYRSMTNMDFGAAKKLLYYLKWRLMRDWETNYAKKFDHCIVVSPLEKTALQQANPNLSVSVIDNAVDTLSYQPLIETADANAILFVGQFRYAPNADAVLWFSQHILPLIRRQVPDAQFFVVGGHPPEKIRNLSTNGHIVVTGYVENLIPYYERCKLSVAPLRAGGGTRLKILESMALGRPVVSTSIGCEGLKVNNNQDIMIADQPMFFAQKAIRLLSNRKLRRQIALNARQLVVSSYDWSISGQKLQKVYHDLF